MLVIENTPSAKSTRSVVPLTLTVSLCPLTDIREGAALLKDDTLTDVRDT